MTRRNMSSQAREMQTARGGYELVRVGQSPALLHMMSVRGGVITAVYGTSNATYDVDSMDGADTYEGITPHDRHEDFDYQARTVLDPCLIIDDGETQWFICWEWEETEDCEGEGLTVNLSPDAADFVTAKTISSSGIGETPPPAF